MNIKVDFDNIVVKEDKNDFNVKVLMLKGEKGDAGEGEANIIEKVQVNGTDLPVTNKTVNVIVPTVDSTLSATSTNPVQNNTIYTALGNKADASDLNNYYEISEVDNLLSDKTDNSIFNSTISDEVTARTNADTNLQNQITSLASGSPLVASSTSGMTDTTRVYVNTTDGNWYYYDGTDWVIGGTYQASENSEQVVLNTINIEKISENIDGLFPNIFNNTMPSKTANGITFTVNADKSVNVSGTATANSYIGQDVTLPAGRYILNGCIGGTVQTYHIMLSYGGSIYYQVEADRIIDLSSETTISIYIRVMSGKTVNTIFYPMIMKEEEYVDEYVPYGVLYIRNNINSLIDNITGYIKPNLITSPFQTKTNVGVQWTVNDDWSVTLQGTPTAMDSQYVNVHLKAGTYIVSGLDENASANNYEYLIIYQDNSYQEYTGDAIFNIATEQDIKLYIRIRQTGTAINTTIYPMIRKADVYNDTYAKPGEYQIYKPIQKLINYTKFNWSGKKMNALGDSIVYGANGNFINVIGGILNLSEVRNYGIGGSCIASKSEIDSQYTPAVLRYQNMSDDADIILVHAGTNDYTAQIPLGAENSTDITTFNGALNTLMVGLRAKYPDKLIIFSGILDRIQDNNPSRYPIPCSTYRQAIEDRCYANHIVYYDGYKYSGFNFHQDYYDHVNSNDGLHPNQTGANILGRKIAGFINWQ